MDLHNNFHPHDYSHRIDGSSKPSMVSESGAMNKIQPKGYYELDQSSHHHQIHHTLNPSLEDPYGYKSRPSPQTHSSGGSGFFNAYEKASHEYLDRRPSFDVYANCGGSTNGPQQHVNNVSAGQLPHTVFVNIEMKDSPESVSNRFVTKIRTNKRHKYVSNVEIDDNETESKFNPELMQRFLSNESSNSSPAIPLIPPHKDNHFNHSVSSDDRSLTGPQPVSHYSGHCVHPSVSLEQSSYPLKTSFNHQKTVSSDSVGAEINDILSHLPPLYVNDIVWSDSEPNDDNSIDNQLKSEQNDENRDQPNSDLESNSNSNNDLKSKEVTEYEVEKYCDQKWESVNGTYDAETEWRPWNSMTSGLSYNGETLHLLPYVDIDLNRNDQNSDSY